MCSQQSVSAIGVESSHLKLWCGGGSEATAATALCRGEATSHNSWAMSHRLEDLPVLPINLVGKNYCDSGWFGSTLFKIYKYYWKSSASFSFTSEMESRHEFLFFSQKKKTKTTQISFFIRYSKKKTCLCLFYQIHIFSVSGTQMTDMLICIGFQMAGHLPRLFMVIISADLWICMLELLF